MNNDFNIILGKKIREIRKSKNISLNKLAQNLNVSYQQLQKYETGANRISAEKLSQISTAFNMHIQHFFGENNINLAFESYAFLSAEHKIMQTISDVKNEQQKHKLAEIIARIIAF